MICICCMKSRKNLYYKKIDDLFEKKSTLDKELEKNKEVEIDESGRQIITYKVACLYDTQEELSTLKDLGIIK